MIELRPWRIEDADFLQKFLYDTLPFPNRIWKKVHPENFFNTVSRIRFYQNADPIKHLYRAIIWNDQICGYVQCERKQNASVEIGYWLDKEYRNQGIMKQAVSIFIKEIFEQYEIYCIYACVKVDNLASQNVLEYNGFQKKQMEDVCIYQLYK